MRFLKRKLGVSMLTRMKRKEKKRKEKIKEWRQKNKWRPSFRLFAFAIIDFPLFVLLSGVCSSGLRRVFMVGAFTWLGDGSNGLYHSCGFFHTFCPPWALWRDQSLKMMGKPSISSSGVNTWDHRLLDIGLRINPNISLCVLFLGTSDITYSSYS